MNTKIFTLVMAGGIIFSSLIAEMILETTRNLIKKFTIMLFKTGT